MKPGTLVVKIVMWIFFLGAIAYFGVYAYHVLFSSYETANLYSYSAEDVIEATGWMVREEQPLEGASSLQEVVVSEGETVAATDTLAVVYENQEALDRHLEIKDLEAHLESLEYILSHTADSSDSAALNRDIFSAIVSLRTCAASGDLTDLETSTSQLRTLMFRRDYTYNGSSALTEEISEQLAKVEQLAEANRSYTNTISAPVSGTFSSMVDGYEAVLTPDNIKDLTPARLHELLDQRDEVEDGQYLGKLVTDARWYFAAELTEENAQRLKIGNTVTLRFNSMARTIDMTVESVSKADNSGTVCVVFSSDKYLAETTLLRDQSVDIVFDTVTGYRVEKSAIHVQNESGDIGVYRVYGAQMIWVSVEILWEEEDYYLIRQKPEYNEDGTVVEKSQLDEARQLRTGAEIVVKGTKLYDGKVVE